jgi:hypothetical protein
MKTDDGKTKILLLNQVEIEIGPRIIGARGEKLMAAIKASEEAKTVAESDAAGIALVMEAIKLYSPGIDPESVKDAIDVNVLHKVHAALKGEWGKPDADLVSAIGADVYRRVADAFVRGFSEG